jgi:hypothetical protein
LNNNSIDHFCSLPDRVKENHQEAYRKHIRSIVLILDDKCEYDRIKDLADNVRYQSKLMAYYGFDVQSGKWDNTKFPVTRTDSQMEGIRSDIQKYNDAVQEYNEYTECLATSYGINIQSEIRKVVVQIFVPSKFRIEASVVPSMTSYLRDSNVLRLLNY